jgi:hypothetical protein
MVAHGRAGHGGHQPETCGGIGDGAEDRPRQRGMALLLNPGKKVVGDRRDVEANLFGTPRLPTNSRSCALWT